METQVMGRFGTRPAEEGRVTVEIGAEAYRVTGARPERETFARFSRPRDTGGAVLEAACGIGVLVEAGFVPRLAGKTHYEAAKEELGRPYVEGFAWGFDGRTVPSGTWPDEQDGKRMREGQRDGRALWTAVKDGVSDLPSAEGASGPAFGGGDPAARAGSPARRERARRAGRRVAANGRPGGARSLRSL